MNSKISDQGWFYHPPKREEKNVRLDNVQQMQPASQIPGLGNHDETPVDLSEDVHLRRKWFRDTDSKYVRLAKGGGRKDIFLYREHKPSKEGEAGYPRVDWFDHDAPVEERVEETKTSTYTSEFPEWYVHEDHEYIQEDCPSVKKNRPILGFDNMSIWKREQASQDQRQRKAHNGTFPPIVKKKNANSKMNSYRRKENHTSKPATHFKLPDVKTIEQIKTSQVSDIGELLSMKYQHEWLDGQTGKRKISDRKKNKNLEKLEMDNEALIRAKEDAARDQEDKPMFKLSRFANVPSKTKSHRN